MNSKQVIVTGILLLMLLFLNAKEYSTIGKALSGAFPGLTDDMNFTSESINVSIEEAVPNDSAINLTYSKVYKKSELIGYYKMGTTNSKLRKFEYILVLDPEGNLLNLEILSYNEIRGKQIMKENFLNRFKELSISNSSSKNIEVITGATISSRSLMIAVEEDLNSFKSVIK